MNQNIQIYLDYQATTPCDPRVVDAMLPYFTQKFGNPHSRTHPHGWDAEAAVETARQEIATLMGADPREIIFTSGATESDNLALWGVGNFYKDKRRHIVTVVTEHKAILDTCRHMEQAGFEVTYLPVQPNGLLDLQVLEKALRPDTLLVSVMAVNSEIGVIQPLKEIGTMCRERGVFFHTDAAQALGKIPLNVQEMNIDLLSVSGHKIYGPKGIGALFVGRHPRVRLQAMVTGGGQERGMRAGTVPTPLCVGLGEACRLARLEMETEHKRVKELRDYMYGRIMGILPHVTLNGDLDQRIPGNLNLSFAGVEGEGLMMGIKSLSVSSGSACTSASLEPSYVLRALGVKDEMAHTSLRIGMGRFTTRAEIETATDLIIASVQKLRAMSPLWEMIESGVDLETIQWAAH